MGLTDKEDKRTKGRVMSWEKIRRECLQIMSAVKELMWVVIDIITKTIERRRHR